MYDFHARHGIKPQRAMARTLLMAQLFAGVLPTSRSIRKQVYDATRLIAVRSLIPSIFRARNETWILIAETAITGNHVRWAMLKRQKLTTPVHVAGAIVGHRAPRTRSIKRSRRRSIKRSQSKRSRPIKLSGYGLWYRCEQPDDSGTRKQ